MMTARSRGKGSLFLQIFICFLLLIAGQAIAQQGNPYVSVSIDSPSAGATFQAPANVVIQTSAFTIDDGVYVSQLRILRSGQVLASVVGDSLSYTLTNLPAGTYTVTANARSNLGGQASVNRTFEVVQPGDRPPVISLNPATGQPFIGPATVHLSANASDPDGQVVRVDYYANGSHIGSSSSAGFAFTRDNVPPGLYQITGVAVDNNGKMTTSAAITVGVEQSSIRGSVDGVEEDGAGQYWVGGWACSSGRPASVDVHIYVGGAAGAGQGIGSVLANRASEAGVAAACQSNGSQYRFRFALTDAIRQAHANKLIYVHGISPAGASNDLLANSGVLRVPAPLSLTRRYVYDAQQRLCKTIEPETGSTVMGYDAGGNLAWSASGLALPSPVNCDRAAAEASGRVVRRTYNSRNRVVSLSTPNHRGNQTFIYAPDGLPSQITTDNDGDGEGRVVNYYLYNKRRLLVSEAVQQPGLYQWLLSYGYDANGNLASQGYPTGNIITYSPNALGQPKLVVGSSDGHTYASAISYFPNGALKSFAYGNNVLHQMTQNARQLPARSIDSGVLNLDTRFDENGNPSDIYDVARGGTYNLHLQYDARDRLIAAGSGAFGGDGWHRYTYDA
ncbi:MAG: hypothetical protein DI584_10450, partial [Stenotrophomonas sp.]